MNKSASRLLQRNYNCFRENPFLSAKERPSILEDEF